MIEIILHSQPTPSGTGEDLLSADVFGRILDDCERQENRDIVIHLAADKVPAWFDEAVGNVLRRPFRLKACFERGLCPDLTARFMEAGHRVVFSTAGASGDEAAAAILAAIRAENWDRRRTELFVPFFSPELDLRAFAGAKGLVDSITLGVGWSHATSGPVSIDSHNAAEWATSLLAILTSWTQRGITTSLACGFPLCIFTTGQLGKLALLKVQPPIAKCPPDLVIGPGRTIRACHRLENTMDLTPARTSDLAATREALVAPYAAFRGMCSRASEPFCRSLVSGGCGGGCLADSAASWTR